MTEQTEFSLDTKDKETTTLEIEATETHISKVKRKITARVISGKSVNSEILQGKTLQVYWYLLEQGQASVREVHNALDFSSPGLVYYQMKKLLAAEIVAKDDKTDKYYINEKVKTGILDFYIAIGRFFVPRFSIYLFVFLLGFIAFFLLTLIWGDQFITNPGTFLLFFFLLFGSLVFIYESMKIWRLKPK